MHKSSDHDAMDKRQSKDTLEVIKQPYSEEGCHHITWPSKGKHVVYIFQE